MFRLVTSVFVSVFIYLSHCPSLCRFILPSGYLCIQQFFWQLYRLFGCFSRHRNLKIFCQLLQYSCPSVCLSVWLFVCVCCLSVSLCISQCSCLCVSVCLSICLVHLWCMYFRLPVVSNVLVESARIARGNIKPLNQLSVGQFDAVVFPGGFGAAKNLYVTVLLLTYLLTNSISKVYCCKYACTGYSYCEM